MASPIASEDTCSSCGASGTAATVGAGSGIGAGSDSVGAGAAASRGAGGASSAASRPGVMMTSGVGTAGGMDPGGKRGGGSSAACGEGGTGASMGRGGWSTSGAAAAASSSPFTALAADEGSTTSSLGKAGVIFPAPGNGTSEGVRTAGEGAAVDGREGGRWRLFPSPSVAGLRGLGDRGGCATVEAEGALPSCSGLRSGLTDAGTSGSSIEGDGPLGRKESVGWERYESDGEGALLAGSSDMLALAPGSLNFGRSAMLLVDLFATDDEGAAGAIPKWIGHAGPGRKEWEKEGKDA